MLAPTMLRPASARLIPLVLSLAVSQAWATDVVGKDGTPGIHATVPGGAGTNGSDGASAALPGAQPGSDHSVIGGAGGAGGNGSEGKGSQPNGAAGSGGHGGDAVAVLSGTVPQDGDIWGKKLSVRGGAGGNAGAPGAHWNYQSPGPTGQRGRGGNAGLDVQLTGQTVRQSAEAIAGHAGRGDGSNANAAAGNASANVAVQAGQLFSGSVRAVGGAGAGVVRSGVATNGGAAAMAVDVSGNRVEIEASAQAGTGGRAGGAGNRGGNGGAVTGNVALAAGAGGMTSKVNLGGGHGGEGIDGAAGGNGADLVATAPVRLTTSGDLAFELSARAGDGGNSTLDRAGTAGNADLGLVLAAGGSATVRAGIGAGTGGSVNNTQGGVATAGGNAQGTLQLTGKGPADVGLSVSGGRGGSHAGMNGASGGTARAAATVTVDTAERSRLDVRATGGAGGALIYDWATVNGGSGGSARVQAALHNAGNGDVDVVAKGIGGDGGAAGVRAGDGAAVTLVNAVSGSTGGKLTLEQGAYGGAAGNSPVPQLGNGGDAVSRLTLSDDRSSNLNAKATAVGGWASYGGQSNGRNGSAEAVLDLGSTVAGTPVTGSASASGGYSYIGSPTPGGNATARSTVQALGVATSTANAVSNGYPNAYRGNTDAFARAAGQAGADARATSSTGNFNQTTARGRAEAASAAGPANAHAVVLGYEVHSVATTRSVGTAANVAKADAEGLRGTAIAQSTATGNGVLVSTGVSATVAGDTQARTQVNAGGAAYELVRPVSSTSGGRSYASVLPDAPSVAALLAKDPQVAAALADDQVIGAGTMQASRALALTYGTDTYVTTANFQFDTTGERYLTLGLLGSLDQGSGLRQLALSVSNHGTALFSQTFASLADARLFFDDHALSLGLLGAGSQDLLVSAGFTYTGPGGFAFQYALGVSAVPEAQTWMMVLLGLTVVLVRRSRTTPRRLACNWLMLL